MCLLLKMQSKTVNKCGKNVIRYFTRITAELKFLIFSFYIGNAAFGRIVDSTEYSESTKKLIRRYLALSYYLYCLRLAALYQFFITFAITNKRKKSSSKAALF